MADSIWGQPEFKPYAARWQERRHELLLRKSYYDGSVYRTLRSQLGGLGSLGTLGPRLYRGTKGLFLPLSRAVDVDAGIIPGDWALAEDAPATWQPAIDQVLDWSDWDVEGVLYIHYGATYGVSGLKIADLRGRQRVVIKPIDPSCFLLIPGAMYDPAPSLAIWCETREDATGASYEYAEVISASHVRTFQNAQPASFDGRPAEYPNDLGFVPFVEVRHIETGDRLGECTYQKAIPLLDEVNELASYLADIIRKHAEAQWAIIGAEPSDLVKSGDNIWFIPAGGDAKALVAAIDVGGVLEFIREIRDNVHGALPELAFDELKSKTQIATATLELQLMELVLKIRRTRPNYDHGLADALRMAGRAAPGLGAMEVAVLNDEALKFDQQRAVLPLDRETEMRLEMQAIALEQQKYIATGGKEGMLPEPAQQPAQPSSVAGRDPNAGA